MTNAERQDKPCIVCGKRESEHPGGRFCKVPIPRAKLEAIELLLTQMSVADMRLIDDSDANVAFDALWTRLCTLRLALEAEGGRK